MNLLDKFFRERRDNDEDKSVKPAKPSRGGELGRPAKENKYFDAISNISAPELVRNFAQSAPPEVQQAIRTTVMGLFGSLPTGQFDSSITASSQNIASLMCAPAAACAPRRVPCRAPTAGLAAQPLIRPPYPSRPPCSPVGTRCR
jgi:hypothetical protein